MSEFLCLPLSLAILHVIVIQHFSSIFIYNLNIGHFLVIYLYTNIFSLDLPTDLVTFAHPSYFHSGFISFTKVNLSPVTATVERKVNFPNLSFSEMFLFHLPL